MEKNFLIGKLKTEKLEIIANMLKAISHPKRIAILSLLENKKMTVTEIHNLLKIKQSSSSHHLGILKNKGILISERKGKNVYYSLKYNNLNRIIECINECPI